MCPSLLLPVVFGAVFRDATLDGAERILLILSEALLSTLTILSVVRSFISAVRVCRSRGLSSPSHENVELEAVFGLASVLRAKRAQR